MSWFKQQSEQSRVSASEQNFYPVTSYHTGFGPLAETDTCWANTNNRGFQTETQVWYSILEDGSLLLCQVIWSYLGIFLVPATTQMTFKHYNPHTKKQIWRSINASGSKFDGQGCKSDQFEIRRTGSASGEELYSITANLDKTVQFSIKFTRPSSAPGFKLGAGDAGGFSTFGKEREDGKRDGVVVHRFHPLVYSSGSLVLEGQVIDATGNGMFVHAIQGMRPDSVASRWNFAFFTNGGGRGVETIGDVRAVQMELETTDSYGPTGPKSGRTKVNIGAIYTDGDLAPLVVTGQTHTPAGSPSYPSLSKDVSSATHLNTSKDKDTGYHVPGGIVFEWEGDRHNGQGRAGGKITLDKLGLEVGDGGGLIEKIDVLAEIPYVIRKGLAAVTGTKPYIFQYLNPAVLELQRGEETLSVEGWLLSEASFISE